jgi:hypothetical protein
MADTTNTPVTPTTIANRINGNIQNIQNRIIGNIETAIGSLAGIALLAPEARNLYESRYTNSRTLYQEQIEFPADLTSVSQHYISFLFQAYQKRSINNAPFLRSRGTIRLPMPDNLKDDTSVTYGAKSLSPVFGATLDALSRGNLSDISTSNIENLLTTSNITNAGTIAGAEVLANRNDGLANVFKAYAGVTENPYQTVLFEKPNFKEHSFTWKLIPSNATESEKIKNIIRTLQFHMLPGISSGAGLLFSFPSMVTISLFPSSNYLYRFKPCVIDKVSVDYAPGGESNPSFYRGTNAPTAVLLKISLQEIEYWTNKDYETNMFDDQAAESAQGTFTTQQADVNPGLVNEVSSTAVSTIQNGIRRIIDAARITGRTGRTPQEGDNPNT